METSDANLLWRDNDKRTIIMIKNILLFFLFFPIICLGVDRIDILKERSERIRTPHSTSIELSDYNRRIMWLEACRDYPSILELKYSVQWSTPLGITFILLKKAKSDEEFKKYLDEIIKIVKSQSSN